jgi:hypothetical protein
MEETVDLNPEYGGVSVQDYIAIDDYRIETWDDYRLIALYSGVCM